MKLYVVLALFWGCFIPCKAQFFDKLIDKAADAAGNALEKKVEKKSTEYTEKATDAVFDTAEGSPDKKGKKEKKSGEGGKESSNSDNNSYTSGKSTILITQAIFEKNAMSLTTNKIPDLDKAGNILNENPGMRSVINAHVESDEDAADLSEFRAMLIKTILVRKYELNEDFISIEISEPGNPNDRNVEIIFQ